jgi:hypothetical protein
MLDALRLCEDDLIIVGDNSQGPYSVDQITRSWCKNNSIPFEVHYANWGKYGKPAGPRRNQEMVDRNPDFVLAFPYKESRGTRNCASLARKAKIKVYLFELLDS